MVHLRHRPGSSPREWKAARPEAGDAATPEPGVRSQHPPHDSVASSEGFRLGATSLPRRRTGRLPGRRHGNSRFESPLERLPEPEAGTDGVTAIRRSHAPRRGHVPRRSAAPAHPSHLITSARRSHSDGGWSRSSDGRISSLCGRTSSSDEPRGDRTARRLPCASDSQVNVGSGTGSSPRGCSRRESSSRSLPARSTGGAGRPQCRLSGSVMPPELTRTHSSTINGSEQSGSC